MTADHYDLLVGCTNCGAHLTPTATGRADGATVRAIATCHPCGIEHLIHVQLTTRSTRHRARAHAGSGTA